MRAVADLTIIVADLTIIVADLTIIVADLTTRPYQTLFEELTSHLSVVEVVAFCADDLVCLVTFAGY